MKVRALLLFFLAFACWLAAPRSAAAEKVKTNQPTKVYSKPGEHEKVLLKLKSGQNMTVLSKDGRWLKVRVQGRTGYVPRSKVDMPDDDEIARNTRRRPFVDGRGTKRGFGGDSGPDDRVGADATGDNGSSDDDSGDKGDKGDNGKDDSDDDDSDSKAKPAAKAKAKPAAKAKAKAKDDDSDDSSDDDDDKPAAKAKAKSKAKAKDSDDDSDDDSGGDKADKGDKGDKGDDDGAAGDDDKSGDSDDADKRPTAHVSAKTVAYDKPSEDSEEQFTAKPSMVLYPEDKKGKWTFVSNDDGDAGWMLTSALDVDDDSGGGGGSHKKQYDVHARLGVTFLGEAMKSTGSTIVRGAMFDPDDYSIGAPTATLALGGDMLVPYKKNYVLGGEVTLDYSKSLLGGINIPAGSTTGAPSGTSTGISLATFNLHFIAGYDLHKKSGMTLYGRLGYRYQSFMVDGYGSLMQNPAMLPQETMSAPTLGFGVGVPHLTDKLGLALTLDTVLAGASISQTKGYQDGVSPSEKAAYFGGVVTYHWKKDMDLQGAYNLDIASLDFGKPYTDPTLNKRGHTGTDTTRSDIFNMFTFGIAKGF